MSLNLFPVRVPIGRASISGQQVDVLMTPEFSRALADLFERVGGTSSPSLTTVVNNLGEVTNIVQGMSQDDAFVEPVLVGIGPSPFFDSAFALTDVESKIVEFQTLLTMTTSVLAELDAISKQIHAFAIQSAFVSSVPPSPLPLAPDATDLPTVITLANSLKTALLSNGIGS